jgi:recombination DNA repair RAD52 pathway protein
MSTQEKLNESIPKDCISDKKGLSYVSGRYVKNRLNEVFGLGWSYRVIETKLVSIDDVSVRWFSHVRLVVRSEDGYTTRDGLAIGHGTLKTAAGKAASPGRANEIVDFAAAESVTDALKRAAVSLGNSLGLELYPMGNKKTGGAAPRPAPKKSNAPKKDIKF